MLRAETEKAKAAIKKILGETCDVGLEGVCVDYISYDKMEEIIAYLQTSEKKDELFETCWVAYRRKGSKKKAKEQWAKLRDAEKDRVLPHVKVYTATRELSYQRDFERYLRDKVFDTIVFNGNQVVYDPTKTNNGLSSSAYSPICGGALNWNEYYSSFIFVGYWDGKHIPDGYTDETRPNGATIMLNNGRGNITWNKNTKQWEKI